MGLLDRVRGAMYIAKLNVGTLSLGGTAITSTAAELNILDGVTSDKDELNLVDNQVASAVMVVGSETGSTINVTVQFKDAAGVDMATPVSVAWYLASDTLGLDFVAASHSTAPAIGTDGSISNQEAGISGRLVSEADGDADIDFVDTGTGTVYLVLVMPNGTLQISGAITHT